MQSEQLDIPILFIIFNRPEKTRRVFEAIRAARPTKLFIVADGARTDKDGEEALCHQARAITEQIDWPCAVERLYRDQNLGCKSSVAGGITWFFERTDMGIILEDDCLPNPSFFSFCKEMLFTCKDDTTIKMVSGSSLSPTASMDGSSYYFSHFPQIWGWATWRRAWNEYDIRMSTWPQFKEDNGLAKIFSQKKIVRHFTSLYDKLYRNEIDTWDGQWAYAMHSRGGHAIVPYTNLIQNIGYGTDATHTKKADAFSGLRNDTPIEKIAHPKTVAVNAEADSRYADMLVPNILIRLARKISK